MGRGRREDCLILKLNEEINAGQATGVSGMVT